MSIDWTSERIAGDGWLALLGGGELTFGETEDADRAWLAKTGDGPVGFLPTASGSTEYGGHFAAYLRETFDRGAETIPIYRPRDARRGKNCERLKGSAAVYVGGGVIDHLLETLPGTPASEALVARIQSGGTVVAIAGAAQFFGRVARSLLERGELVAGLGWLRSGVVEPNFDPGHDHRLRQMLEAPAVSYGLGIAAGSAILLGPEGKVEIVGEAYVLGGADEDLQELS